MYTNFNINFALPRFYSKIGDNGDIYFYASSKEYKPQSRSMFSSKDLLKKYIKDQEYKSTKGRALYRISANGIDSVLLSDGDWQQTMRVTEDGKIELLEVSNDSDYIIQFKKSIADFNKNELQIIMDQDLPEFQIEDYLNKKGNEKFDIHAFPKFVNGKSLVSISPYAKREFSSSSFSSSTEVRYYNVYVKRNEVLGVADLDSNRINLLEFSNPHTDSSSYDMLTVPQLSVTSDGEVISFNILNRKTSDENSLGVYLCRKDREDPELIFKINKEMKSYFKVLLRVYSLSSDRVVVSFGNDQYVYDLTE